MAEQKKLIAILGPTGVGKSAVAMEVARKINGEIISCDSMLVYRGMDIGTAKPTIKDRTAIPHHLIDILDIHEPYNVKLFCDHAMACIMEISSRQKIPILCGGSGLYARALLTGYQYLPGNKSIAHTLRKEYIQGRKAELIAELKSIDPQSAAKVSTNPQRLIRALEIIRVTGKPISSAGTHPHSEITGSTWIIMRESGDLRKRIEQRVDRMLQGGWIDETKKLLEQGLLLTPTASKALGYRLIAAYLAGDIPNMHELNDRIVHATCQYAKRQRTWFRHQHPGAMVLELDERMTEEEAIEKIN